MATSPNFFGFEVAAYIRDRCHAENRGYSSPCWIWQRACKADGYAIGKPTGFTKTTRIARVAYQVFVGSIPDGMEIDHLCKARSCCNPAHLEAVTHSENMARQVASRTSCRRGHPFDAENLYVFPNGARTCRTCKIDGERTRPPRQKESAA